MYKLFFKMFKGMILKTADEKIDWAAEFGREWVDGEPDEDGLMSAIEEELTPREREVAQMAINALAARVKQEYRELLTKAGYTV
jgi:predicted RNA-binding protein associated with RNAse of E/G family